jgi:polyisoprenoid-binding protein YceI
MSRLSISLVVLLLVMLAGWHSNITTRFNLTEVSTLWVTGTSSLHDWRCDAAQVDGWVDAEVGETLTGIPRAEMTVQAKGLECKNGTMNKKTYTALNADNNPAIRYKLTKAEVVPGAEKGFSVKTTGQLTIAGKTRTVTMKVNGNMMPNGQIRLTGELPVTMSDYGIDPPTAMLGTLKTGDDVVVHFEAVGAPTNDL